LDRGSSTMKRGILKDELPASVAQADAVFVYSAGLDWDAQAVFAPLGQRAACFGGLDGLVEAVAAAARDGDHVVVMSNGGFGGVHQKLLTRLAQGKSA
jgi:UDP-N-acetylmuramate: L-alanyl-gamma-D-glutamyl-meso-diaminopimelate ligase